MPFLRSSTRPQAVECFFCLSPSLLPPQPQRSTSASDRKGKKSASGLASEVGTRWNWHCTRCGCWNVRDDQGNMISDHPAMHNSQLNELSFSLRGRPSSSHLPSTYTSTSSTFCHNCLTNQTLIMNLLANYLPDDDDPTFPPLYAALPSYLDGLHTRYPPVCATCQPAVDDALKRSHQRALTEAWGSALRRGAVRPLEASGYSRFDVVVWRIRGVLFCMDAALCWAMGVIAIVSPDYIMRLPWSGSKSSILSMSFHLISILWIAWDPYWLRRMRSDNRIRISGRAIWVRDMLLVAVSRFGTAFALWSVSHWGPHWDKRSLVKIIRVGLTMEALLFIHATVNLRVDEPVALKLIRPVSSISSAKPSTSTHPSRPASPSSLPPVHSSSVSTPPHPVFGQESLRRQLPIDDDKMDWEPAPPSSFTTNPRPRPPGLSENDLEDFVYDKFVQGEDGLTKEDPAFSSDWDNFATRKQRIFPRQPNQDETGLETLLAGWGIATDQNFPDKADRREVAVQNLERRAAMVIDEPFIQIFRVCLVATRVLGAAVILWSTRAAPQWALVSPGIGRPVVAMEAATTSLSLALSRPQQSSSAQLPLISPRIWFTLDLVVRVAALFGPPLLDILRVIAGVEGFATRPRSVPINSSSTTDSSVSGRGLDNMSPAWTWCAWAVLDLVSVLVAM